MKIVPNATNDFAGDVGHCLGTLYLFHVCMQIHREENLNSPNILWAKKSLAKVNKIHIISTEVVNSLPNPFEQFTCRNSELTQT